MLHAEQSAGRCNGEVLEMEKRKRSQVGFTHERWLKTKLVPRAEDSGNN
jgi:hypothetical protein